MVAGKNHERVSHSFTGTGDEKVDLHKMWLKKLKKDLPEYLPQHRLRIYTVGICADVLGDGAMIPPSLPSMASQLRANLSSALSTGLPALCEERLRGQQRENLMVMKQ
eukprot:8590071-Karenia_brevis.AAC.2